MTADDARAVSRGGADFRIEGADFVSPMGRVRYRIGLAALLGKCQCLLPGDVTEGVLAAAVATLRAEGFAVSPVPDSALTLVSWEPTPVNANEARQAAARNTNPAPDPAAVKETLDVCHNAITKASNRGAGEVDIPIGMTPEPILAAVCARLRTEGYTVFRNQAANGITVHW